MTYFALLNDPLNKYQESASNELLDGWGADVVRTTVLDRTKQAMVQAYRKNPMRPDEREKRTIMLGARGAIHDDYTAQKRV